MIAVALVILYGGHQVLNRRGARTGAFFSFITALLSAYQPLEEFLAGLNVSLQ